MTDYSELVKALRCCENDLCRSCGYESGRDLRCVNRLASDAAAAIEEMAKHITEMHERVTVLQIDRGQLEAEVKRLKECNDELREKQTFIDHYGNKWRTGGKDILQAAYDHGYMDGWDEARAKMEVQDGQ